MQYITLDKERFIEVDLEKNTSRVFVKAELEKQLKEAQERLSQIPEMPSDEELLEWAKENYPMVDYSREKQSLEQIVAENSKLLESIK